ncbi:MAG: hypothetical protein QXZ61_03590 [Saccharolobus sp.]
MNKSIILILLILFFTSTIPTTIINSQNSNVAISSWGWGTPQNPIKAYPGYNDTPFYVIVSQAIGYQIVYAYINLAGTPITSEGGYTIAYGSVSSSSLTTSEILFFLNINENAKPETYNVPITIVYQNVVTGNKSAISQTISIPVYNVPFPVLDQVFWGTQQQLTFAQVGEGLVPLTIVVSNPTTEPMLNVTLNIELPKGLYSQIGSNELNLTIPALPAGQPEFITSIINISNIIKPGVYNINYSFSYTDILGYFHKQEYSQTTKIIIYPQTKLNIITNPIVSTPKNITVLTVKISANVSSTILTVKPIVPNGILIPISSNFTPTILQSGQSVTFYFKFYIPQDVLPSLYPLPIQVNYTALGQPLSAVYLTYANIYYNETPKIVETLWNTTITPFPGIGVVPLTLIVYNPLPYPITAINITYNFPNGIIPLQPYIFIPAIPQFGVIPVTIPVEVMPNAPIGSLNFSYEISYDQNDAVNGQNSIYILPPSPVIIQLNKTIISEGSYNIIPIKVVNLGPEYVYNINLIVLAQGLEIITAVNNTIPYLKPNSSDTFYYTIYAPQDLPPSDYPLIIKLTYTYFTTLVVRTFTIPIVVTTSQQPLLISFLKTTVYYNTNNTEVLVIQNLANYSLYNIQLQLNYPTEELYISNNRIYIPYLPPHYIYTIPLYIIPQIPQTISIPIAITVNYITNEGSPQTYEYQISLLSTGFVKMQITQVSAQVVNNSVIINGLLINTGSQNAQFVIVYVNNYSSLYIGNIPPNSPTPFSFTLSLPPGKYVFNITVSYENGLYESNHSSYFLPFIVSYPTSSSTDNSTLPLTSIFLLLVIIILISIIIYLSIRGLRR